MTFDDPRVQQVFEFYRLREASDRQRMKDLGPKGFEIRDEFLLSVGEEAAWFLHSLIIARSPKRILELGTSYGYSTLFLADAARQVGASVVSMELADYKQLYAHEKLEEAGLDQVVDFLCGDALELLADDPGPFDFVLLDIWKDLYVPCFEAVYPRLAEEAVLCSDNMIEPDIARLDARALREGIRSKGDMQTALLPIGQGIELSIKWSAGNAKL